MARLLHIYRRYYPDEGGIEWTMRAACEHFAARGHEVNALVSSATPRSHVTDYNGVCVIRSACVGTVANTPLCPAMPIQIARLQPDLIELHHAYPWGMWAAVHSGHRGRLIVNYHFDISRFGPLQHLVNPLLHRALHRADAILVNSHSYAATSPVLSDYLDKCEYIPAGVEPARFELTPARAERIQTLRADDRFRVLFVGRLSHYKGLEDLVAAMQWVDGNLIIVGRGKLMETLQAQAAQLGIAERVHLLGRVDHDELVCQYHAADAVVLPSVSRGESFGVAQVEAMLCGRAVVCSDLPGVCEVGVPGQTTCLFPRGDAHALADALNHLAADPAQRERLGRAGRDHALAKYDIAAVNQARWEVCSRLLGLTEDLQQYATS